MRSTAAKGKLFRFFQGVAAVACVCFAVSVVAAGQQSATKTAASAPPGAEGFDTPK